MIVTDFDESDSALVALLENLQREDLSYMEEAQGYAHLINQHRLTQEEVAAKVGKNQSTIANKLRILKLGPARKKDFGGQQPDGTARPCAIKTRRRAGAARYFEASVRAGAQRCTDGAAD